MDEQEQLRLRMKMEEEDAGEPGHPGHDPYADGPTAHQSAPAAPEGKSIWRRALDAMDADPKESLLVASGFGGTLPGQDPLRPMDNQTQSVKGLAAKRNEEQLAQALSFMQGGSGNHVDELSGLLFGDAARQQAEKLTDEATERYPGSHVAGALATSGPAAESAPARIVVSGLLGANAAHGAAKDNSALYAGGGGIAGAGTAAVLEGVTHGASRLAPWLKDTARNQTIRSLNPNKSDIRMLGRNGIADSMADDLLKSGAIKFGRTADDTAGAVADQLSSRGTELGSIKQSIDKATGGATVLPDVAADSVEDIAREYLKLPHPESQAIGNDLMQRAALIRAHGGGKPMSLGDAESMFKAPLDKYAEKVARTPGAAPEKVEALAQTRRAIKESNEKAADAAATVLAPDLAGKFVPAKQAYGRMAAAADILERSAPGKLSNRALSPSDYGFGIATGQAYQPPSLEELIHEPVKSVGKGLSGYLAALAHKAVRERGNTAAAVAANVGSRLSGPVSSVAKAVGPVVPDVTQRTGLLGQYLELAREQKELKGK